jgi:hypothetical protein
MKRALFIVVLAVTVMIASFVLAQDQKAPMTGKEAQAGMMSRQGMMGQGEMWGMRDMMMGSMMDHSMVASGDGGVIVMIGDKLMKYDKDLNLVKEVQIAIDLNHMNEMMTKMMEMWPMHQGAMQGGMMQGGMMRGGMMQQTDPKEGTATKK